MAGSITCPCSNNRPTSLSTERLRQPPQLFTQSVLVDYEIALRSAVLKVWPGTTLRSCWFHYKQALFRHLQAEGLSADYMVSDSHIKTSFSTLCAMPYDPEEDIEIAWKELKLTLPPEMTSFARYCNLDRNSLLTSPLRQRVLGPSRLHSDASTTLFEYSRRMEQRLRFTCQLPKSNYMELSRMRQEGASHHGYEDR